MATDEKKHITILWSPLGSDPMVPSGSETPFRRRAESSRRLAGQIAAEEYETRVKTIAAITGSAPRHVPESAKGRIVAARI